MKKYFLEIIGIGYLCLMFLCIHSCSVTDCLGVACTNGTCIDGKCNCNTNFEGPACKTIIRNKFLGNYKVASSCFVNETYPTQVNWVSSTNYTNVIMYNLLNLRIDVTANITDSLHLQVPTQTVSGGGQEWTITGSGYINTGKNILTMSMNYVNSANNINETCSEVWTKN